MLHQNINIVVIVKYTCFLQSLDKIVKLKGIILFLSAKCSKNIVTACENHFPPNGLFIQSVFSHLVKETNKTSRHVVVSPRYQIVNFLHKTTGKQVVDRTSCICDFQT